MEKEIIKTWSFSQAPKEIWDYLTKPELMEQWLMKSDFKPVVGHKFRFTFTAKPGSSYEGVVNCEVLEVKPFTQLAYTWNGGTQDQKRKFNSNVKWTLVPKGSGTELHLVHKGFDVPEDITAHSSGWESCIKRMEDAFAAVAK